MGTRNVTLTLEKAKEFYNSGNAALKEWHCKPSLRRN